MLINNCRIIVREQLSEHQIIVVYEQVAVEYSHDERCYIENQWQITLARNANNKSVIFNGNLFSLRAWCLKDGRLKLTLGNTTYKNYVGTRSKEYSERYSTDRIANPLAVCAAIVTRDSCILIEQRQGGDVYNNYYHVIGGFMDRDWDIVNGVVKGPFFSIEREIREEIFLDVSPTSGTLTGLVYDERNPHPELCFTFQTDKSADEIIKEVSQLPDGEVGHLFAIANDAQTLIDFMVNNFSAMSITGFGCLLLHGAHTFGEDWLLECCSRSR